MGVKIKNAGVDFCAYIVEYKELTGVWDKDIADKE